MLNFCIPHWHGFGCFHLDSWVRMIDNSCWHATFESLYLVIVCGALLHEFVSHLFSKYTAILSFYITYTSQIINIRARLCLAGPASLMMIIVIALSTKLHLLMFSWSGCPWSLMRFGCFSLFNVRLSIDCSSRHLWTFSTVLIYVLVGRFTSKKFLCSRFSFIINVACLVWVLYIFLTTFSFRPRLIWIKSLLF